MASDAVRGLVNLASGLGELTRARALEAAQGLLALPGAEEVGKRAMQASTLADQLLEAARANRAHLVALVRSEIESALRRGELARHADVESARAALASLTHEVDELRASLAAAASRIPLAAAIPGMPSAAVSTAPRHAAVAEPAPPASQRAAEKATTKKSTAKKASAKKTTASKATAKKASAKKTTASKATAKKTAATRGAPKKSAGKTTAARRSVARKSAAKKAPEPAVAVEETSPTVAESTPPARVDETTVETTVETTSQPPTEQAAVAEETAAAPAAAVVEETSAAPAAAVVEETSSAPADLTEAAEAAEETRPREATPAPPEETPPTENTATRTNDT